MLKRILVTSAVVGALFGVVAPSAEAALINGGISFSGSVLPGDGGPSWVGVTKIDFQDSNLVRVAQVDGDFATEGVPLNYAVAIADFVFNPFTVQVSPLWSFSANTVSNVVKNFSFNLELLSSTATNDFSGSKLDMVGVGTLKITGYDDTQALWTFSSVQTGGVYSFAMATSAPLPDNFPGCRENCPTITPEPGSMILLGTGLVGAARAFRKKQARKS